MRLCGLKIAFLLRSYVTSFIGETANGTGAYNTLTLKKGEYFVCNSFYFAKIYVYFFWPYLVLREPS